MKYAILALIWQLGMRATAQYPQLHYSGTNAKIIEAIAEANKILADPAFYLAIDTMKNIGNTTFSAQQISAEMKNMKVIEVVRWRPKVTRLGLRSKANASTLTNIGINYANLNRIRNSIVNTLIHEAVHATDWFNHHPRFLYTHDGNQEEDPSVSAPNRIGDLGEVFAGKDQPAAN
jgi:hypothetical protein